ncbi:hypothetical protein [Actinomadura sp. 21ATH]|uniref:hypothetical protein n=1 Tax=Actinomadura sp. 21ATH TaxID=1735444 RepID=UPI0035C009B6
MTAPAEPTTAHWVWLVDAVLNEGLLSPGEGVTWLADLLRTTPIRAARLLVERAWDAERHAQTIHIDDDGETP